MDEYYLPPCSYAVKSIYAEYLASADLTLDGVKELLGTDFVCADKVNVGHECPLLVALTNQKCSIDIVEHLLQYNSTFKCRDMWGLNCLFFALVNSRDEAIVRKLLEKGAEVINSNKRNPSFFCVGIHYSASKSLLKLLFDAKCYSLECGIHGSLMHCALNRRQEGLTEDFLELLLSVGGDLNAVNQDGQSPLCLALQNGQDAQDIELLLSKGASLNACKMHDSPMLCATNKYKIRTIKGTLRADVIRLLIKKEAAMDKTISGYTPLQLALLHTCYEAEAIRLMLDHPSVDVSIIHDQSKDNLLHIAVRNPHCKASVVQWLINRGVRVDENNKNGRTPLDVAMMRIQLTLEPNLNPEIIEVLLKNGSPGNGLPETEITPLKIAVLKNLEYCILKLLFGAGARVDLSKTKDCINSLFQIALNVMNHYCFKGYEMRIEHLKLILKCSYLESPDFDIQCLCLDSSKHSEFFAFADECRSELLRMKLQKLSCDHTLQDFARNHSFLQSSTMTNSDYDQLLRILSKNAFPIYLEVMVAKIGRESLDAKLEEVPVYTFQNSTSSTCAEICIVLNYECVRGIIQYLSDEDLMTLIVSYFKH